MNFTDYSKKFKEKAIEAGKNQAYIECCLDYARHLQFQNLPIIYSTDHFSKLVGIKFEYLYAIANCTPKYYRKFKILKHNGKKRQIAEPLPTLKQIQKFILQNILYKIPCSPCSKAFVKNRTLRDNAKFHKGQKTILKIDIKDYFPSLHGNKVYAFFKGLGYTKQLCVLFTKLCTLSNSLPQGAPTSPYLSNLLTVQLDEQLFTFCQQSNSLRYTRYADDITISGDFYAHDIIPDIYYIIKRFGLIPNCEKTTVIGQNKQQKVTGIVVNKNLQASKEYRRKIRLEMYYIVKYGIDNHSLTVSMDIGEKVKYLQNLLGRVSFCLQINPKDTAMKEYRSYLIDKIRQISDES